MITRIQGLKTKHTPQDVIEAKRQVRVLELIDLFEYVVFATAGGKDPRALWNKMFVNIGNIPGSRKFGWFWNQITDLKSTSIDEEAYKMLCQMWRHVESTFQHLRTSLQGNLSLLALKFYMRLCEKKKEFEQKNNAKHLKPIKQISVQQIAQELFEDIADSYVEEENSSWSNLHKAVPSTHKPSGLFKDVADQTVNTGSEKGLAMFKHRIRDHLNMVPESALIRLTAHYVGQIIYYAQDTLSRKLEYITIPELDLD